MVKRKIRDAELEKFWRQAHARHAASGLSVSAFCSAEGLKNYTFWYWGRELRARDRAAKVDTAKNNFNKQAKKAGSIHKGKTVDTMSERKPANKPKHDFVPVNMVDDWPEAEVAVKCDAAHNVAEIVFKSGHVIRIASDCPLHFLSTIVSAMEGH
jgi:hypothetical protein